jgi:Fic family protein
MNTIKPANKPANSKRLSYILSPVLPGFGNLGPLRNMAQELVSASAGLEGKVAAQTAVCLGDLLRIINSYYSNLIEGHKTTIPDIKLALKKKFNQDPQKKYAQELCAAHVNAERELMKLVGSSDNLNICSPAFISGIHAKFYAHLPPEHLYTHAHGGFTRKPVEPGMLRDVMVSVDGDTQHGPDAKDIGPLMAHFSRSYDPARYYGDDRLIAMAVSHHRLTWLHPFRDGNGRVARLFSGLYLARIGINRKNLWSLSRGFSRNKQKYMFNLWATDSPEDPGIDMHFSDDLTADFCQFFFSICLDQIDFMTKLLQLDQIDQRIDWFVATRSKDTKKPLRPEAARLLRAVFMRGAVVRGQAGEIMNMSERTARRTVSDLLAEGLLESGSHRAPLTIGLPVQALPYYFPDLYEPALIGHEYVHHFD